MSVNDNTPRRDPDLPPLGRLGNLYCPRAPQSIAEARLEDRALVDLALKAAFTINRFTEDWLCERLLVAPALAAAVALQLSAEGMIEETMSSTSDRHVYRLTDSGHKQAARALEVWG